MNEALCVLMSCDWWVVTTDTTPGRYPTQCMKVSQTHPVGLSHCTTGGNSAYTCSNPHPNSKTKPATSGETERRFS